MVDKNIDIQESNQEEIEEKDIMMASQKIQFLAELIRIEVEVKLNRKLGNGFRQTLINVRNK